MDAPLWGSWVKLCRTTDIQAADFGLSRASLILQARSGLRCLSLVSPLLKPSLSAPRQLPALPNPSARLPSLNTKYIVFWLFSLQLAMDSCSICEVVCRWHGSAGAKRTLRLDFSQNDSPHFAGFGSCSRSPARLKPSAYRCREALSASRSTATAGWPA